MKEAAGVDIDYPRVSDLLHWFRGKDGTDSYGSDDGRLRWVRYP